VAKKKRHSGPAGAGASVRAAAGRPAVVSAPMDLFDRIAWWCLHALVLLVPPAMSNFGPFNLDGLPLTYDQFDIVKVFLQRGFILIALGAWLIGLLVRGGKVRWHWSVWLVLGFLAWVGLTSVLSIHPPTAIFGKYRRFEGLISFVTYAVVFFMVMQYADRPSRVRSLARTLAISGFVVAAYGVTQVIGTIGIGTARILQPLALVAAIAGPVACIAPIVLGRVSDPETRRALFIGAGLALLAGAFMAAGLQENIAAAVATGVDTVALDPVRWGRLGFETNRAFSTYGNPDMLGAFLIFPFAVVLGLALTERHTGWRAIYWVFTLFNVFVGLTSYTRGAWIGATIALIAIAVAYVRARKGSEMRLKPIDLTFIAGSLAAGITVIVTTSLRDDAVRNVLTRILSIFEFGEGSALTRFQIWDAAISAIAERPVFGWGADTFRLLFPMFKPAEYVEAAGYISVADNVHNYPLQLASGIGIPGALLMYGLIAAVLTITARDVFARGKGTERLLLAGFWAAWLGYVVALIFGLSVTGVTVFMWLTMGILVSSRAATRVVKVPGWGSIAAVLIGLAVAVGLTFNTMYIVADHFYLRGKTTSASTGATSAELLASRRVAISEYERALDLNPYNDMYRLDQARAWEMAYRAAHALYLGAQGTVGADSYRAQVIETIDRTEQAYLETIDYVPYEYDTYVFLTAFYNDLAEGLSASYVERAIQIGEIGRDVEPYGPAIRVLLGRAYLLAGRDDDALAELEFGASLDSDYLQGWKFLGDVRMFLGDLEGAREAYEHVMSRDPQYAGIAEALAAVEASESAEASASGGGE
jgi:O-antigen ligase/tetratricopeptide (TPR) repeat protein